MTENLPDTNVGNIEYICKQDAITAACKGFCHPGAICPDVPCKEQTKHLRDLPPADVVQVETLKAEIYKLKCQQDSKNQDYYTGYMSALSTVEGILAEMEDTDG